LKEKKKKKKVEKGKYLRAAIFSTSWSETSETKPLISERRRKKEKRDCFLGQRKEGIQAKRKKKKRVEPRSFPMHSMAQTRISSFGSVHLGMTEATHFSRTETSASIFLGCRKRKKSSQHLSKQKNKQEKGPPLPRPRLEHRRQRSSQDRRKKA